MTTILILVSLLPGQVQFRQCQTAYSYRQTYAAQSYVPLYQQQTYAYAVKPYYDVKIVPVIQENDYYAGLVGGDARALTRRKEDTATVAALTASVAGLTTAVRGLEARIGTVPPPVVQPPPIVPSKPTPDVPGKPAPDVTPGPPPTPKVNPGGVDNGDVPPPPPVPGPGASKWATPPPQEVLTMFQGQCVKCHVTPAKAGKGFVMFSEPGKLAQLDGGALLRIDAELYSGGMPKDGDPIDAKAYSVFRAWMNENKPLTDAYLIACRAKQ